MIQQQLHTYSANGETFEGVLCWDDSMATPKPGVLIAHTFRGQSQHEVNKAIELAKLGYVGFAIDMYGKGRRAATTAEADALLNELNSNRPLLLRRIQLALKVVKEHPEVDKERIGAIGFCSGGKCVLDLARSGEKIKGVVSFHGVYDTPPIHYTEPIQTPILILHGWEDPLATPAQVIELAAELTRRKADWQLCAYGHTGHAFTNPNANDPENGMFYQPKTDKRSWLQMINFFNEVFVK